MVEGGKLGHCLGMFECERPCQAAESHVRLASSLLPGQGPATAARPQRMSGRVHHPRFRRSPLPCDPGARPSDKTVPVILHPNNPLDAEPHSFPCIQHGGYIRDCIFGRLDLTLTRLVWNRHSSGLPGNPACVASPPQVLHPRILHIPSQDHRHLHWPHSRSPKQCKRPQGKCILRLRRPFLHQPHLCSPLHPSAISQVPPLSMAGARARLRAPTHRRI